MHSFVHSFLFFTLSLFFNQGKLHRRSLIPIGKGVYLNQMNIGTPLPCLKNLSERKKICLRKVPKKQWKTLSRHFDRMDLQNGSTKIVQFSFTLSSMSELGAIRKPAQKDLSLMLNELIKVRHIKKFESIFHRQKIFFSTFENCGQVRHTLLNI